MTSTDLVVFDGDDTLWRTQEIYDDVKVKFAELVHRHGLGRPDLIAILDRIDAEAAQTRGFTVERFLDSMNHAYELVALDAKQHPTPTLTGEIREIARPLWEIGSYQLYPDTVAVLRQLSRYFELVLATKGQRKLQEAKVKQLGLVRFFAEMHFVEQKTETEYLAILAARGTRPHRAWAVGNSIRSDINPALRAGMRAIWIRRPSWLYEDAELRPPDIPGVDSLTEAAQILMASRVAEQKRAAG
jgi:putative hydrolase of the HAD superfamily